MYSYKYLEATQEKNKFVTVGHLQSTLTANFHSWVSYNIWYVTFVQKIFYISNKVRTGTKKWPNQKSNNTEEIVIVNVSVLYF